MDIENYRVGRPRLSPKVRETVTFTLAAKKMASNGRTLLFRQSGRLSIICFVFPQALKSDW